MEKLLILPFDHRSSFVKDIAQSDNPVVVSGLKNLIFKAFLQVWDKSSEKETLGILIDDEYGQEIIQEAKEKGINFAVSVEKSGSEEFEFEHGDSFEKFIEKTNPTYIKVLIRYNPENENINKRQLEKLEKLELYNLVSQRKVILELLVPPMGSDLNNMERFEQKIRPAKTIQAVNEISAKINPEIWKMEGFSKEGWELIFSQIPLDMKVIVLGRGENEEKVTSWLETAAQFPNILGFAVGRTVFSDAIKN